MTQITVVVYIATWIARRLLCPVRTIYLLGAICPHYAGYGTCCVLIQALPHNALLQS